MKRFFPFLYMTGALLVLLGVVCYFPFREWAPYVYLLGALLIGGVQLCSPYKGNNTLIKRLYVQRTFGIIFLIVTGVLMLTLPRGNEWILCLTLAAILQLYTAYRIPVLEKKEEEKLKKNS